MWDPKLGLSGVGALRLIGRIGQRECQDRQYNTIQKAHMPGFEPTIADLCVQSHCPLHYRRIWMQKCMISEIINRKLLNSHSEALTGFPFQGPALDGDSLSE
jgi:hypothetical protein